MAQLKPALDDNLPPVVSHTLREWVNRWVPIRGTMDGHRFALTGHYVDEHNVHRRAAIDFARSAILHSATVDQICDFDSVIGILRDDFPIQEDVVFDYHVLNDSRYCLSSDLHIPGWPDPRGGNNLLPFHKIPHAVFGTLDNNQTVIRVFFPHAVDDVEGCVFLDAPMLEPFYNLAVLPAVRQHAPAHYSRTWPPSYEAEATRAANKSGRPQFSGKQLRGAHVKQMIPTIITKVNQSQHLKFASGCFWMVEMKGLKNSSAHPPPEEPLADDEGQMREGAAQHPRTLALAAVLRNWEWVTFEAGDWYLDIATTVSVTLPGVPMSTLIKKDAHAEIIRHFTQRPIDQCQRWVSQDNGASYKFDATARLTEVGGFRLTIHDPAFDELRYFQAYTTEKSLTYHKNGRDVALFTTPKRILTDMAKEKQRFFDPLVSMFMEAAEDQTHSNVAVRFESRVPFHTFTHAHMKIPRVAIQGWLVALKTQAIWSFKAATVKTIGQVLDGVVSMRHAALHRQLSEIATLVVALAWLANANIKRADCGGTWDEIRDSISVHELNQVTQQVVPVQRLGCIMLHSLKKDPIYRLSASRVASDACLIHAVFMGEKDMGIADLIVLVLFPDDELNRGHTPIQWGEEPAALPGPSRYQPATNNKRRRVALDVDVDEPLPPIFGSGDGMIRIPGIEAQQNQQNLSDDEDNETRASRLLTYAELNKLVQQVAVQVFAKTPNQAQGGSYCKLSPAEKLRLTNAVFASKAAFKNTWHSYTLFKDPGKWESTILRIFPSIQDHKDLTTDKNGKKTKIQGLSQMSFWADWVTSLRRVSPALQAEIVTAARQYANRNWHWFPVIEGRKLWNTAPRSKGHVAQTQPSPLDPAHMKAFPNPESSDALAAIEPILQAQRIFILTGAGISTGAGIPDFRSEDGLYRGPHSPRQPNPKDVLHAMSLNSAAGTQQL
ncbi:hypothetical protein FRC06_002111, partial [Ceratobasidium sp. 370]